MGCFYIESPAMRLLQEKAGKGDFEHLVIHSSIIRPAANEYIQKYLERLHGGAWDPIHPLLSDVLAETFGIMVYQEDVSRVAVALAGFSAAEADGLRKILSKKDRVHALRDYHARFREGALARGVSEAEIEAIWQMILSFDGYSFCKPHSASYARVSFQAAWLKTHFPAEFMAAVISNRGGFYSAFAYVSEARRLGLTILPPDVNRSGVRWSGKGREVRVGLLSIKGLSAETRKRIEAERGRGGFSSLEDFLLRVTPNEDETRQLVHCGALDRFSFSGSRGYLTWMLARYGAVGKSRPNAPSLFRDTDMELEVPLPVLPPDDPKIRLRHEFSVLGFLCGCHPMAFWGDSKKRAGGIAAKDIRKHVGKTVTIAGWLITGKKVRTKRGDTMEFLTFEDDTGLVETTFFPGTYERFCHILDWGRPYLLSGLVEENWGAVTLTVQGVRTCR
jgi:DNA polymerase-3 subunit alpha/error-prone DNA polymerase